MRQIAHVETARMTALAEYLDTDVPARDFDLRTWISRVPHKRKTILFGLIQTRPECGFAGCAMGWAAYSGMFPGFIACTDGTIQYRGQINFFAVMKLLGISYNMVVFLFHPKGYKVNATPEMVASRLRRLVVKIKAIRAREQRRAVHSTPSLKVVA